MAIHIPSGKMTALPSYNMVVNNIIDNVNYSYNSISNSLEPLYSFTIDRSAVSSYDNITLTAQDIGADAIQKVSFGSNQNYNNYGILIRKKISTNDKIMSFNYRIEGGFSYIDNIVMSYTNNVGNLSQITIPNPRLTTSFGDISNDLSRFYDASFELFQIEIAEDQLKYNCVEFVLMLPIDYILRNYSGDKITVTLFDNVIFPTDDMSNAIYNIKNYSIENEGFSLTTNELYQNQTVIRYNDGTTKPMYEHIVDNLIENWQYGRETMNLTCVYGRYYSYNPDTESKDSNEVVIDGIDGRMIDVGDIVIPTRLYTQKNNNNNIELPISQDKNGNAKEFEVLASEIEFTNGRLVAHLKLMEVR